MKKALVIISMMFSGPALATELVYTPINPSFGGSPLNGNFLLQKAQSQNDHEGDRREKSFVEQFQDALERNIINSLTRRIADGEITEGVYNTGEYRIEVTAADGGGVTVHITNIDTGEVTVITVPGVGG